MKTNIILKIDALLSAFVSGNESESFINVRNGFLNRT